MEQGGNSATNSRTCVPGYQQEIQSNINGLPRQVEQEVTWTKEDGTERTAFKAWTTDWGSSTALGGSRPNRDTAWNFGGVHSKDFTFHLMNSDSLNTPSGSEYDVFNYKLKEGDITQVVGAINLMDNPKYKMTNSDGWNAYCVSDLQGRTHKLWGAFLKYASCKVVFDNTRATKKLMLGEQPSFNEMFNITSKYRSIFEPDT